MLRESLFCVALAAFLSTAAVAADPDAGKALYAPCVACHGSNGEGNPALNSPGIAGQSESYLMRQLWDFKKGKRGTAEGDTYGAQMRPMAMTLPDGAAIANVAAYIASLPAATPAPTVEGDAASGEKLSELTLDTIPVFDGLAAAGDCLYVSAVNGKLVCLGGK